ncbi:DNA double-strand break repair rad50 ATPase [Acinetobacter phage vB_AbaM_ME3]|uniref:DNA double-strand break repair rad50 ATPase n=1 Tax=Acinetobacter phage vB_AbaM_ME3 TaxID=1837876 RepID=A0A172Q037_9CAUD|nr:DNA double-strand break repair rad50 ATPase [Acinetobacter phage vB_AbaM_ME3]AND75218.1 DNA double-strand break repair rad50 ATPase [Acinetobacter phage vB_AbaM_ME3]
MTSQVIDYIIIKNSFAHKDTRVDFKPGRNYIIGNYGSGKSELIEMIGFAFFGTCSLRGKATTYKGLYVELQFNYLNDTFLIKRKTNDASLNRLENGVFKEIANSTTTVNNKIISILGYDYNIYLLSNYCQQGKLQYFSELTPAKRLQFIDKVSGIEDAKELTDWLNVKRKELKVGMDTLRDMLVKPKISSKVNLDIDYDELLNNLKEDYTALKDLYSELDQIRSTKKPSVTRLSPLSEVDLKLSQITKEQEEALIVKLNTHFQLLDTIDSLRDQKRSLLKGVNKDLLTSKILDVKEVNAALNQVMVNSLDDLILTCPKCEHTFDTSEIKTSSHLLHSFSVKDLSLYLEYLSDDTQTQIKNIESTLAQAIEDHNKLLQEDCLLSDELYDWTPKMLTTNIKRASDLYLRWKEAEDSYEQVIQFNLAVEDQIKEIQTKINSLLVEQQANATLRSEYIALKTEKDIYLAQLALYEEAQSKNLVLSEEHDIVVKMIKEINEITDKIKKETIPLINHHSSNYLNTMTKGVMTKIEITDTYDLIVDGSAINLKSGAQKDLSSLAFRLSLGQSIILGMLPLFIGDEIDASSPVEVANDITEALDTMSQSGYQMILITHKDTSNLENCNIINLG